MATISKIMRLSPQGPAGPAGATGAPGSDASVTAANVLTAGQAMTGPQREDFREAIGSKEYLDVRDYGAVANWNGTIGAGAVGTNDRAALQAALDAAYSGDIKRVRLAGRHFISGGPLDIKGRDLVLEGRSRFTDFIYQHSADQHCLRFVDQISGDPDVNLFQGLRDLSLRGRGIGTATGTGIFMNDRSGAAPNAYNGAKWRWKRIDVRGFEFGADIFFWDGWCIDQCIILGNNTNLQLESFTNTVEIRHSSLGSAGTRSLRLLGGATVTMKHMDFGNEPQAAKVAAGASLYIQDSNLETFTGTAPTYRGIIEMEAGSKFIADNLIITSAGSSLPGVYLAGANECYILAGGLYVTNATGNFIEDASQNSRITSTSLQYGTNGTTGAVKVLRTGKHAYKAGPFQTWQNNGVPQIPTAAAGNRTDLIWSISNDLDGVHVNDRLFAMVRGRDQLYTAEPLLNRDMRVWDYISGTTGDLVKNTRVRDNNSATLIEKFLPATAASVQVDDAIDLMATGAGGIKIKVQPAQAHLIRYGASQTTANSGFITLAQGASCRLVCWSASGGGYWMVTQATGTITVT